MLVWNGRDGYKIPSRDWLGIGSLDGKMKDDHRKRFIADTVMSLVGYDANTKVGSKCILQGIQRGYINPDAKIYGIERDINVCDDIEAHAKSVGIDMDLFRGNLVDFKPPQKLDLAILDLMCQGSHWIGKYMRDILVPMMSADVSAISVNLNVQRNSTGKSYDDFVKEYYSDTEYWKSLWTPNYQRGDIDYNNPPDIEPFTGILCFKRCLPTFVGVHMYMKDTGFNYRGCYRYYEPSGPNAGPQYMLSLRYERA
jgi:hypothetical protein